MRPTGNGVVELHDTKQKERGFNCMKLIIFLTEDGVTDWSIQIYMKSKIFRYNYNLLYQSFCSFNSHINFQILTPYKV